MAEKLYKIDEEIVLGYQAPNKESGLSGVVAEIYLPGDPPVKDSNFPDVALVEVGSSGTYRGKFTPDAQGTWQVIMHKSDGDGQVTKSFSVGAHNVHSVGEAVATVDSTMAKDATVAKDSTVAKDNTVAKAADLAVVGGKVDAVDLELDTVRSQLTDIDNKVGALDTPPMAF
jgi:hypothetical protein